MFGWGLVEEVPACGRGWYQMLSKVIVQKYFNISWDLIFYYKNNSIYILKHHLQYRPVDSWFPLMKSGQELLWFPAGNQFSPLLFLSRRRGGKYAVGSACIGGGQGIAVLIENTAWWILGTAAWPELLIPWETCLLWQQSITTCLSCKVKEQLRSQDSEQKRFIDVFLTKGSAASLYFHTDEVFSKSLFSINVFL